MTRLNGISHWLKKINAVNKELNKKGYSYNIKYLNKQNIKTLAGIYGDMKEKLGRVNKKHIYTNGLILK